MGSWLTKHGINHLYAVSCEVRETKSSQVAREDAYGNMMICGEQRSRGHMPVHKVVARDEWERSRLQDSSQLIFTNARLMKFGDLK